MRFRELSVHSFAVAQRTDPYGRSFLCLRFLDTNKGALVDMLLAPIATRLLSNMIAEHVLSFGAGFLAKRTLMIDDESVAFASRKANLPDAELVAFTATALVVDLGHAVVGDAFRLSIDCADADTVDVLLDVDLCIQLSAQLRVATSEIDAE